MSNYNRSIDFTAKDALSSGDPNKVIKGSDMDSELDLVGSASATKANKIIPAAVGNVPKLSGTGDLEDSAVTLAELQILDGATVSTAELNILDGVTATASEINALDGITSTVTELNHTDGVTSAIQTQLDAKINSADSDTIDTNQIVADAVLVSSKVDKTIGSTGSEAIAAGSSWVIPVGFYNMVAATAGVLDFNIQISSVWYGVEEVGGLVWSDGTNMRIFNNDSVSRTVRWQKMS